MKSILNENTDTFRKNQVPAGFLFFLSFFPNKVIADIKFKRVKKTVMAVLKAYINIGK